MATFKLNKTEGRCSFCGRPDRNHCAVSYPRDSSRPRAPNNRNLRVCSPCGLNIVGACAEGEDRVRTRKVDKAIEVFTEERRAKRQAKREARKRRQASK
jgi:hypothetical protein